jgi:hypothetical protein
LLFHNFQLVLLRTGRLTAGPSTNFGALGAEPSIYSGGALDHHVDVNKLEEALWWGRCKL